MGAKGETVCERFDNLLRRAAAWGWKPLRHYRALQAGRIYVGDLGGSMIEIRPGDYLMRDSLQFRSRVTVRHAGVGLLVAGPSRWLALGNADVTEPANVLPLRDHERPPQNQRQ